jgi:hypothetical protein
MRGPLHALDQVELAIRRRVAEDRLPISKFKAKGEDSLNVVMYRKGKMYQIYQGSSTTDYEEISRLVVHNI